jgi:hypothetical protein
VLRTALLAIALLGSGAAAAQTAPASRPTPPPVAAPNPATTAKLSTESLVSELLADAKAKDVLNKHVPHIVSSPQLGLVMGMKFSELQQFPEAALTPEIVTAIDADLAKL